MFTQILDSSFWQTIGTIIAIVVFVSSMINFIRSSKSRKEKIIVTSCIALIVLIISGGIYWFISMGVRSTSTMTDGLTGNSHSIPAAITIPSLTPVPSSYYRANWETGFGDWGASSQWSSSTIDKGVLTSNGSLLNDWIFPSASIPLNSYSVKVQIQRQSYNLHTSGMAFGVMVKQKTGSGGYVCGVGFDGSKEHAFISLVAISLHDGKDYIQKDLASLSTFNLNDSWHTYEIDVRGTSIAFLIDNQLLGRINDSTYVGGEQVGLYASYTILNVKNFVVSSLDQN